MYKSDEELLAEALARSGLLDNPRFPQLSACVSTLLAVGIDDLSGASHEDVLLTCKHAGFVLEDHADVRCLVEALDSFREVSEAYERELRAAPFHCFEALFYRDRHGQLMATFSMGPRGKVRVPLDAAWERKFALVYQTALQMKLQGREIDGVHDAEDGDGEGT